MKSLNRKKLAATLSERNMIIWMHINWKWQFNKVRFILLNFFSSFLFPFGRIVNNANDYEKFNWIPFNTDIDVKRNFLFYRFSETGNSNFWYEWNVNQTYPIIGKLLSLFNCRWEGGRSSLLIDEGSSKEEDSLDIFSTLCEKTHLDLIVKCPRNLLM